MADTDVRDVIAKAICARYESIECTGSTPDEWVNEANAVLTALARAGLVVVAADQEFPIKWVHCTPDFVAHNSCETAPRRACRCPIAGSHDHAVTDWDARAALPVTEEISEADKDHECAHCGQPLRGSASIGDRQVCHTDEPGRLDCYRLVTVYGEQLGAHIDHGDPETEEVIP